MSTTAVDIAATGHRHETSRMERTRRARRRARRRREDLLLAALLLLAGTAVMLYPKLTDIRYEFAQWQLARSAAAVEIPEDGAGAEGGIVLPDGAVARLAIPAIGVDAYIVEGTDRSALAKGPGHYLGTPLPGEDGNAAIAGHRTMNGHVFHDLHLLTPGDEIRTWTGRSTAVYRVVDVLVVHPGDTAVIAATADDRLTLTTCNPIGSAAQRLVVVAELED